MATEDLCPGSGRDLLDDMTVRRNISDVSQFVVHCVACDNLVLVPRLGDGRIASYTVPRHDRSGTWTT